MITIREITPLKENDCFMIFKREKSNFTYPIHFHPEYEINLILGAKGAKRVVGDHISEINNTELVMVGGGTFHGWLHHNCKSKDLVEATIQFNRNIFGEEYLNKNQLTPVKKLLEESSKGIKFSSETALFLKDRILNLNEKRGFDSVLELMSIIYDLSISRQQKILASSSFVGQISTTNSRRIEKVYRYIQNNFKKPIKLKDASNLVGMTEHSFARFFKQRTNKTFIESLSEIRLGHATKLLVETTKSVSEICYECGFNNLSNFNRTFKAKKKYAPKEFRKNYNGVNVII